MRSFLGGWGGVAFLRDRLAATRAGALGSSEAAAGDFKTASSFLESIDFAFFIGGDSFLLDINNNNALSE